MTPNVTYYYEISAYNLAGESKKSNVVFVTTKLPNESLLAIKNVTIAHDSSGIISVYAKDLANVGGIRVVLEFDPHCISIDGTPTNAVDLVGKASHGLLIVKQPQANVIDISVAFSNEINLYDDTFLQVHVRASSVKGLTKVRFIEGTEVEDINTNPISFDSYDGNVLVE